MEKHALMPRAFGSVRLLFLVLVALLLSYALGGPLIAAGRWPLLGLIAVTLIRTLFIRQSIDVSMSGALVVATAAANLYLSEISSAPLGLPFLLALGTCFGVLLGLSLAHGEAFAERAGVASKQSLSIDLGSLFRILTRLFPVGLAVLIFAPDLMRQGMWPQHLQSPLPLFGQVFAPHFGRLFGSQGNSGNRESAGPQGTRQRSGISNRIDVAGTGQLELDWTPIVAVSWHTKASTVSNAAHLQYWRSHSLSKGFGLAWELSTEDLNHARTSLDSVPGRRSLALVFQSLHEGLFLFHPWGTRALPFASGGDRFVPLASGGGFLKSPAGEDAESTEGTLRYELELHRGSPSETLAVEPPQPIHLEIPAEELTIAAELAQKILGIPEDSPVPLAQRNLNEVVPRLRSFFGSGGFAYSLSPGVVPGESDGERLVNFLRESKRGFCEHYASATTTLLRAAGVPARVAMGLSASVPVQERQTLLRRSDAHAWVEAWNTSTQRWEILDPTLWVSAYESLPSQRHRSETAAAGFTRATLERWLVVMDDLKMRAALSLSEVSQQRNNGTIGNLLGEKSKILEALASQLVLLKALIVCSAFALGWGLLWCLRRLAKLSPFRHSGAGDDRFRCAGLWSEIQKRLLRKINGKWRRPDRSQHQHQRQPQDDAPESQNLWARERFLWLQVRTGMTRTPTQSVAEFLEAMGKHHRIPTPVINSLTAEFERLLYAPSVPRNELSENPEREQGQAPPPPPLEELLGSLESYLKSSES